MGSLTDNQPKCLTKLRGRELIKYQMDAMREGGIEEIAIVTGFLAEQLTEFGDFHFHNPEWATTNMVASLQQAENWLIGGICIVSYSDIFFESHVVRDLVESKGDLAVAYDPKWLNHWSKRFVDPLTDAETFRIDSTGRLLEIGGRATSLSEIEGQYMGLLRFSPSGWSAMEQLLGLMGPEQRASIQMTNVIQRLIDDDQIKVQGVKYEGKWGEIDSAIDLFVYENETLP
jgi:choline kinase